MNLERRKRTMTRVLLISPLIVVSLTLLGVGLGFYLARLTGLPPAIPMIVLSTVGFLISLPILVKMIDRMIANESREEEEKAAPQSGKLVNSP